MISSPTFRPDKISVLLPLLEPVSTAYALNTFPSFFHTFFSPGQSSMLSPSINNVSLGLKRRALEGMDITSNFSIVYMVTLAVKPGFSFRSSFGAEITTS